MTDTKAETAATLHATALSLAGAEGEAGAEAACCRCGARDPRDGNSIMQSRKLRCAVPKRLSACPQHASCS